jgi:hypothetical protein
LSRSGPHPAGGDRPRGNSPWSRLPVALTAIAALCFLGFGGLTFFLFAHFALFPAPWARYMMGTYVLAGLLFARAAQQDFTARR